MTIEEAHELKRRLLNDPDFMDEFIAMDGFKAIIEIIRQARFKRNLTDEEKKRISHKAYEIICHELSDPNGRIRCNSNFWNDAAEEVRVKYGYWLTPEEGMEIIDRVIKLRNYDELMNIIKSVCITRLRKLMNRLDEDMVDEMMMRTLNHYLEDDCRRIRSINNPGALRSHITSTVCHLYNKHNEARITESFPNPNKRDCGYAHLSMVISMGKMIEYLGEEWYESSIQDPFRSSVEQQYDPYSVNPSYINVASKNRNIEKSLDDLFQALIPQKANKDEFPVREVSVSYDRQFAQHKEYIKYITPALRELMVGHICEDSDELRDEAENPRRKLTEEEVQRYKKIFNKVLHDKVMVTILIRKYVDEESSKEIGYFLYKNGLLDEQYLHGYPPESDEGREGLAERVNRLSQQARQSFKKGISKLSKDEIEELGDFFNYVINKSEL